jgi:hypothetical protein
MKKTAILMLGFVLVMSQSCQQKKTKDNQINVESVKNEVKANPNKMIFDHLDQILSPFEDMTEFALNQDEEGVLKSLAKIETATKESVFANNLTSESLSGLNPKIEALKTFIKEKNYTQTALVSTEIFKYNVTNFADAKKIENQIRIEHLDYLGFKVLALLSQDNIDWSTIERTIINAQQEWRVLEINVTDINLKDSFNFLFKGLYLSAKNHDIEMGEILAAMDLSLVDVLENNF